jgi:hypothetical protein
MFAADQLALVNNATAEFVAKVKDPKAAIIPSTLTTPSIDGVSRLYALFILASALAACKIDIANAVVR